MNPADLPSWIDETSSLPIARIDAQEEEFVGPLREYLETNGCQVFTNKPLEQSVAYHIVTGDVGYVKSILSKSSNVDIPTLAIILGSSSDDVPNDVLASCRIVVVDPVHLTNVDVSEIFSFFFAGNETVLDKRRNIHEPAPYGATPESRQSSNQHDQRAEVSFAPIASEASFRKEVTNQSLLDEKVLTDSDRARIGNIISDVFQGDENKKHEDKEMKQKRRRKRKMKIGLGVILGFVFLVFIFPLILYGISMTVATASFVFCGTQLKKGNITEAQQINGMGEYWLHQAQFSFLFVAAPFRLMGIDQVVRGQERLVSLLSDVSSAFDDTLAIATTGKDVANKLLASNGGTGSTESPASDVNQLHIQVISVFGTLGLAQAELTTLLRDQPFPFSIPIVLKLASQSENTLETLRGILSYVDELLTLYPRLAGYKNPVTYLVLLQNSDELRPTGGFIGSVGTVTFQDGVVNDFSLQDVYALDGQLKGHVDPPGPLKDLMGTEHWYLRDSNWDPDYEKSATRAAWFYQKESGNQVDGVIAINVPVVIDILSAIGPIYLPDYNDRISADNFFGKSFYYTQNNFFPGSTQKSDFLGTLSRAMLAKLTQEKSVSPIEVFRAIAAGLMRKDILFMFNDPDTEQLVEHFGWGGQMFMETGCEGVDKDYCSFDPLAAVEANVSVSKVNYFIKHSAVRDISIEPDGTLTESLSCTLRNTANVLPASQVRGVGGAYISYIRFYMSNDSSVDDVTLDGQPIPTRNSKQKGPPTVPYIENTDSSVNARAIGVAVNIPAGTEHTIRVTFKRGSKISFGRGGSVLDLLYYKHPGVSDQTMKTLIHYPLYWTASDESKDFGRGVMSAVSLQGQTGQSFLAKEGQLEYNNTILQDQVIRVRFVQ